MINGGDWNARTGEEVGPINEDVSDVKQKVRPKPKGTD